MSRLHVFSLLGPSGAGKTSIVEVLPASFNILESNYRALDRYALDTTTLLSKLNYFSSWFNAVLSERSGNKRTLLTDRCPIDSCAYVINGQQPLLECLKTAFEDLSRIGVRIHLILITCEYDKLEARITKRTKRLADWRSCDSKAEETNRRAFKFYRDNGELWNDKIDTTLLTKEEAATCVQDIMQRTLSLDC